MTHLALGVAMASSLLVGAKAPKGKTAPEAPAPPVPEAAPAPVPDSEPAPINVPPPAPPPAKKAFAAPKQVAVGVDFQIGFSYDIAKDPAGGKDITSTGVLVQPSADYFLAPHLSLGGQVILRFQTIETDGGKGSRTAIGLAPRVGYDVAVSGPITLFPRLGVAFEYVMASAQQGTMKRSSSDAVFAVFAYVPFLFHPAPHFFLGIGPAVRVPVAGPDHLKTTSFGLASTVGGWFDWM